MVCRNPPFWRLESGDVLTGSIVGLTPEVERGTSVTSLGEGTIGTAASREAGGAKGSSSRAAGAEGMTIADATPRREECECSGEVS